jgi:hypothetical protein
MYRENNAAVAAVLVNAGMAGLDTQELIRGLTASNPGVRIVNTAGGSSAGLPAAVRATLPKPYGVDELLRIVEQVVTVS